MERIFYWIESPEFFFSRVFLLKWIIFGIESWVKQYWIEYWMNHLLAKFKHWIESQIGYRPPLPPFHPVIPLLHPYTPVPAWYKPITPYCITVTPSYTPVAWSTNCLDVCQLFPNSILRTLLEQFVLVATSFLRLLSQAKAPTVQLHIKQGDPLYLGRVIEKCYEKC